MENNNVNRMRDGVQNIILFFTDALCIMISYYLSGYIWLMAYKGFSREFAMHQLNGSLVTVLIALIITVIFTNIEPDFIVRGKFKEARSIVKKILVFGAFIAVYELLRRGNEEIPRGIYVVTIFLSCVFMFFTRQLVKRYLFARSHNKRHALNVIVVTTKDRAAQVIKSINKKEDWIRDITALVIVDANMVGEEINGIRVGANAHTMMEYIKNEIADEVYLDLDYQTKIGYKTMVMELEDMGVTVHMRLELLETFNDFDAAMGHLGTIPVVTFANRIFDYKAMLVKRIMDIAGSIVGMIFLLIAMIIFGPIIKLTSPGPIFFKQKRVGKGGRYFYIYKFRSMYQDAEKRLKELTSQNEMSGFMFKMEDDPRITPIGKFLRKTSIDELPQFINVFKGDMSLVGTRPPTVGEFKQYHGHHKRRLSMKPGITGMWQAYGRDTVTDFEEVVKMDLEYIDNWNLGMDIKILGKTVVTLFTTKGK